MKNCIYGLALFCFAVPSALQAQRDISLPGLVVRQNSRVKTGQIEYLSNVNIKATQATPTLSDGRGQFSLVFSDKPAYNVTRVFAEKSGMEVVNKTDLERAAVVGRLQKLKIVMCPANEMMENQMVYYGIAEEAIVKRFKTRIAKLEATNTGLDNMIAEINKEFNLDLKTKTEAIYALEKEWSEALTSAQETAQKFASINLDDADSLYLQADAAFKKGDFERVLQLLQYNLLDKNIRNIRSNLSSADSLSAEGRTRMARGQENLQQTIQNALFAARVAKLDGAWNRAEAYYDLAVKGDEQEVGVVFEAAYYLQSQNKFAKARTYYEKALTLADQSSKKSNILNNLGILLKANNEMGGAKKAYDEALQIRRTLAEKNPEVFLPVVAGTLNNLGEWFRVNNEIVEAKKAYDEALQIYTKLAEKNPEVFMPDVAMTLNNLGEWLRANNEMVVAKKAFEEALKIYRTLAEKNPEVFLPYVAMTFNNLGALFYANNEMGGAKNAFEEALKIYRTLAEKNLEVFLPYVASTLNNLGEWFRVNNEIVGAKKAYDEALPINRQLAEKNPEVFLPVLATTLNNLGILLKDNNEMDRAKKAFDEALPIYRQLAEKNPDVYMPDVAMTLNNLGNLLSDNNEMGGAKKAYEEALHIYRQLAEKNHEVFLPVVATTLNNLGLLLKDNNEMGRAKKAYDEALQIRRKLAEKNPEVFLPDVAMTLNNLGSLLMDNKEMGGAKKAYDEALQIYRQLAEKNLEVFLPDVAMVLYNLGILLKDNNEMGGAKKAFEEALQIRRKLAEKNPEVFLPDVATTLNNLGALLQTNNEMGEAKQAYEEALQIRRKLAEKNPEVFLPNLATILNNLGLLLSDNNEISGAKKAFEEALQIRRKLAEKNPEVFLPDVAMNLNYLGNLSSDNNEMREANQAYEEALQIYRKLAEKNPNVFLYLPVVATTLNNLGNLLSDNNEMSGAKKAYEEALQIRRKLAEKKPKAYNLDVAETDINMGLFYEQLLKKKGEMSLKAAGLELMGDAEQRLAIFPEAHPRVQQYRPYIQHLTQFFNDFDEAAFQLQQQINRLSALETANETEKDPQKKVKRQQEIIGIFLEIEKTMPGSKEVTKRMAAQYGSLAWYQLFIRQFAEAEQSARFGLAKDPSEEWINTNLALALLYQGKWKAAKEVYLSLKDKKYSEGTYKDTFLSDLKELEKAGISHPDAKKVRALLGEK